MMWNSFWGRLTSPKKAREMPTYDVEVCRTSWGNQVIRVEADTEEDAKRLALDKAGDIYFSEHDADYEAIDVWMI